MYFSIPSLSRLAALALLAPTTLLGSTLWVDKQFVAPAPRVEAKIHDAKFAASEDGRTYVLLSFNQVGGVMQTYDTRGNLIKEIPIASGTTSISSYRVNPLPRIGRNYLTIDNGGYYLDSETHNYLGSIPSSNFNSRRTLANGSRFVLDHERIKLWDPDGLRIYDKPQEFPAGYSTYKYMGIDESIFAVERKKSNTNLTHVSFLDYATGSILWTTQNELYDAISDPLGNVILLESINQGDYLRRVDRMGNTIWQKGYLPWVGSQHFDSNRNRNAYLQIQGANFFRYKQGTWGYDALGVEMRSIDTGDVVTEWQSQDIAYAEPCLSPDGLIFYNSSADKREISARRASDGVLVYRHTFDGPRSVELCTNPVVPVVVSKPNYGVIEGLDLANGGIKWRTPIRASKRLVASAGSGRGSGDRIVVATADLTQHVLLNENLEPVNQTVHGLPLALLHRPFGTSYSRFFVDAESHSYFVLEGDNLGSGSLLRYDLQTGKRLWTSPIIRGSGEEMRVRNGLVECVTQTAYFSFHLATGVPIRIHDFTNNPLVGPCLSSSDLAQGFASATRRFTRLNDLGSIAFQGPTQTYPVGLNYGRELPNGKYLSIHSGFAKLVNRNTGLFEQSVPASEFNHAVLYGNRLYLPITGGPTLVLRIYDANTLTLLTDTLTNIPLNSNTQYSLSTVTGADEVAIIYHSNDLPGVNIYNSAGQLVHATDAFCRKSVRFVHKVPHGSYVFSTLDQGAPSLSGDVILHRAVPASPFGVVSTIASEGQDLTVASNPYERLDSIAAQVRDPNRPTYQSIHQAPGAPNGGLFVRAFAKVSSGQANLYVHVLNLQTGQFDLVAQASQGDEYQTLTSQALDPATYVSSQTGQITCRVSAVNQTDTDGFLPLLLSVDQVKVAYVK